jgi:hypothetical protein
LIFKGLEADEVADAFEPLLDLAVELFGDKARLVLEMNCGCIGVRFPCEIAISVE